MHVQRDIEYVQRKKGTVSIQKQGRWTADRQDAGDKSLTWKSFDGVVGDTEIRLEGLKCNNLSSDTISVIPTFFSDVGRPSSGQK